MHDVDGLRPKLTDQQVAHLVIETGVGFATIRRVYAGRIDQVTLRTYATVTDAAKKLGIHGPPQLVARIVGRG